MRAPLCNIARKAKMVLEFDLEYMNDNISPFGFTCPDDEAFIEKFDELLRIFHQTMDQIIDEVISIMQNEGKTVVTMAIIDALEYKLDEHENFQMVRTPKAKKPVREPLADRTLATLKETFDEKMDFSDCSDAKESGSSSLTGKYAAFSPFSASPANVNFLKRIDAGKVISKLNGSKYVDTDRSTTIYKVANVQVISKLPELYYGGDKSSALIEAKFNRLAAFADDFRETYPEISHWGDPLVPSAEIVYTYGQIIHDETRDNERLSDNSVSLMIDDEDGSLVQLDFSNTSDSDDITLFPGQIVAFSGTNETGKCFFVNRIFSPSQLPLSKVTDDVATEIWFAAGPFTSAENCGYEQLCDLLEMVLKEQPQYLILTGPFIDRKNTYLNKSEFNLTYDMLMEDLMQKIESTLINARTEVIIQPSGTRDHCVTPFFPASPFLFLSKKKFNKKMHFVADPCVVRLCNGGLEIGITSSEIITHLSKNEYHRSSNQENSDRISRLNSHLLSQRSFYPLEPAEIPCSMENAIEIGKLSSAPHIFVTPSILPPHVKKVNQTAFVNPSNLAKGSSGSFVKARINLKAAVAKNTDFSVVNHSVFEILKI